MRCRLDSMRMNSTSWAIAYSKKIHSNRRADILGHFICHVSFASAHCVLKQNHRTSLSKQPRHLSPQPVNPLGRTNHPPVEKILYICSLYGRSSPRSPSSATTSFITITNSTSPCLRGPLIKVWTNWNSSLIFLSQYRFRSGRRRVAALPLHCSFMKQTLTTGQQWFRTLRMITARISVCIQRVPYWE